MVFVSLVGIFLSIIISAFYRGFISLPGIACVLCLYILLLILFFNKNFFHEKKIDTTLILSYLLTVSYTLFLFFNNGIYQTEIVPSILIGLFPIFILPIIISYLFTYEDLPVRQRMLRFGFLLCAAFALRLLMVWASPKPIIDVYTILKEAPQFLLQGINPYNTQFSEVYQGVVSNYYPYWPLSFLLEIPFMAIFEDPRILMVLSDVAAAFLIYLIGRKTIVAEILSLIYLFRPNSLFIIEQSWLVNLEFLFFILTFYFSVKKSSLLSGVFLGCLLGVKPHYLPVAPFILLYAKDRMKSFFGAFMLLVVLVVPFIIWDKTAFWQQTIGAFFQPNSGLWWIPYPSAMSLNALYFRIFGNNIPFWASIMVLAIVYILIFSKIVKKNNVSPLPYPEILLGIIIFFLTFNLFFRLSFINQYYFIGSLVILWSNLLINESKA